MIELLIPVFAGISIFFAVKTYNLSRDVHHLQNALVDAYMKDPDEEDIMNEQFLKFVSDSREWAFEYIEDVQSSIKRIIDFVEPSLENNSKEYTDRELLNSVYKSLKGLLPEQDN